METVATDQPGRRIIYEGVFSHGITFLIVFALAAMALTLWYLAREGTARRHKLFLLVAWGVIPPCWFLVEYFFLFLPFGVKDSFGFFQYGQSVAAKVWGAVFALISVTLYTSRDKDGKNSEKKKSEADD